MFSFEAIALARTENVSQDIARPVNGLKSDFHLLCFLEVSGRNVSNSKYVLFCLTIVWFRLQDSEREDIVTLVFNIYLFVMAVITVRGVLHIHFSTLIRVTTTRSLVNRSHTWLRHFSGIYWVLHGLST